MVAIRVVPVTPLEQNCRILISEDREAVVVDPGGEVAKIVAVLTGERASCTAVWLTHSHFDHCGGVAALLRHFPQAKLFAHPGERIFRGRVEEVSRSYGIADLGMENCPEPSVALSGGEELAFGGEAFNVIFVPGHSPGHVAFYNERRGFIISGDVLFAGSVGRTDLPGSCEDSLMETLRSHFLSLPDACRVLPGHGPETTIGAERRSNPFLRALVP